MSDQISAVYFLSECLCIVWSVVNAAKYQAMESNVDHVVGTGIMPWNPVLHSRSALSTPV